MAPAPNSVNSNWTYNEANKTYTAGNLGRHSTTSSLNITFTVYREVLHVARLAARVDRTVLAVIERNGVLRRRRDGAAHARPEGEGHARRHREEDA